MFGREPLLPADSPQLASDTSSYSENLKCKLQEMYELVKLNFIDAATTQKHYYDRRASKRFFNVNDHVWLSQPVARKLDPKWEKGWMVVKSCTSDEPTVEIAHNDGRTKVVHVNRIQHHNVRRSPVTTSNSASCWSSPSHDHFMLDSVEESTAAPSCTPQQSIHPTRTRRPPDRYGTYFTSL